MPLGNERQSDELLVRTIPASFVTASPFLVGTNGTEGELVVVVVVGWRRGWRGVGVGEG